MYGVCSSYLRVGAHLEFKRRHLVKSSIIFCLTGWRRNTSQSVQLSSSSCLTASALPESLYRSTSEHSYARLFIWVLPFKLRSSCLNSKSSYPRSHLSRSQSFFFFECPQPLWKQHQNFWNYEYNTFMNQTYRSIFDTQGNELFECAHPWCFS